MAQYIHHTQKTYQGPWLFEKPVLDAFDKVLDELWDTFEAHKKQQIENAVERMKTQLKKEESYKALQEKEQKEEEKKLRPKAEADEVYKDDGRRVTLTFDSGDKFVVERFADAVVSTECYG